MWVKRIGIYTSLRRKETTMFTITAGCFNQPCDLQEQIGKSIVIADYASPDEAGKHIAKRIGKIVAFRRFWSKNATKITNLITVEYQEDNHYAEKTISAYHLSKIRSGVILPV